MMNDGRAKNRNLCTLRAYVGTYGRTV